jgi:Ca2+-binding RTX toxin-like protein
MQIDGYGGRDVLDLSSADWPQSVYLGTGIPSNSLWAIGIALVIGSDENDHLVFASGDVRAHFRGRKGDDTLIGGPLDDVLTGGQGNDTLRGKTGTDTCNGGPGMNTIAGCELP